MRKLKELLVSETGLPVEDQILVYDGETLAGKNSGGKEMG